jgi:prevent-host-death family protein
MRQHLSPMEFRRRLGEILDRVHLRQDQFVIARKGKPLAALVPVELLDRLQHAARLHLVEVLDRDSSSDVRQSEADALADEAKHRTRPTRSPSV